MPAGSSRCRGEQNGLRVPSQRHTTSMYNGTLRTSQGSPAG